MVKPLPRLKLQGFNNLTKSLSFNIYDVCYAASEDERRRYIEYIDEEYNADRLTQILTDVAEIIGANILNIARQDYDPQGASVTILISEQPVIDKADAKGVISDAVVAHLGLVEHEAAPVSPQLDDEALPTDGLAPVGLQLPHVERDDPGAQALPVRRDETQPEGTQLAGLEGDRAE